MTDLSDYITTREAAEMLGISSRQWVRDLIKEGRLRAIKVGGIWLVLKEDVKDFERKRKGPKSENY